ncbi:hypothetical protein [Ktedonospora formicarum]|uniref:hypothetical protein n=1 Tax=Ktedonospora formicarum TaxID=2778364 RepID=UPI001C68B85B|nr:hypothetical protein [Ktedonospora formicarum]
MNVIALHKNRMIALIPLALLMFFIICLVSYSIIAHTDMGYMAAAGSGATPNAIYPHG